jgi:hypothetical protein
VWITAIAAFAATFVNPLAGGMIVALALLLPAAWSLRAAAASIGAGLAYVELPAAPPIPEVAAALAGAVLAALLWAELALHFVLPGCRFGCRLARRTGELLMLAAAALLALAGKPGSAAASGHDGDAAAGGEEPTAPRGEPWP